MKGRLNISPSLAYAGIIKYPYVTIVIFLYFENFLLSLSSGSVCLKSYHIASKAALLYTSCIGFHVY